MVKIIDLSQEIRHRDKNSQHPAVPMPLIFISPTFEEAYEESNGRSSSIDEWVNMGTHTGTHMDSQRHSDPNPKAITIDQVPLEWCYGDAICIDLSDKQPKSWITPEDLDRACIKGNVRIKKEDILLLYTGHWNRTRGTTAYSTDWVGLNREAVEWIKNVGVKLFGIDAPAPDNPIDQAQYMIFLSHDLLREEGLPHIENLANLDKVVNKRFIFIGFPIKVKGASGSWIRAVALLKD
ncbi:cyclase family protein [Thermoproteota archaeon]